MRRILDDFSNICKEIVFTIEDKGTKLKFLDLDISIVNNKILFNIYRKKGFSPKLYNGNAKCSRNVKEAFFYSNFYRAIKLINHTTSLNKELNFLINLGLEYGFDCNTILKILRTVQNRINNERKPKENIKYRKVKSFEGIDKIRKIFKVTDTLSMLTRLRNDNEQKMLVIKVFI